MRVLVYGGGAVGLGVASCLLQANCAVDILARPETADALRSGGLTRTGIFGNAHAEPESFGICASLSDASDPTYDFVLVCTKSFDSECVAQDLADHPAYPDSDIKFVLFQNGWGNAEAFARHFAPERIYSARVITGFHRHRLNEVEITVHADAIHVGSLYKTDVETLDELCRAIQTGGIPCQTVPEIGKDLWAKMLYNCALNPLGAILHVPYGALAAHASTRSLMNNIIGEVFTVMSAAGYETHWGKPEDFVSAFYGQLVPATAEHESSMLQDITAGKRTEIEALNGAVIRLADEFGTAVPHNRSVYDLVKFVESAH